MDSKNSDNEEKSKIQNDSSESNSNEAGNFCIITGDRVMYTPHKTRSYVNRNYNTKVVDFNAMTHEDLVSEVTRLQRHCFQLRNLLLKSNSNPSKLKELDFDVGDKKDKRKPWRERPFDFKKYHKRHVFVKFAYFGWDYQGFTIQEGTNETVEYYLFEAFKRAKLIESRETSNYHRCGRTDKGVSAFSQVVSIDFRSNCASGKGVIFNPESQINNTDIEKEIDYVKLLNGTLPNGIRALAWSPVEPESSARFDCTARIYRYYLPKGDLDIDLMRNAGKRLIGEKDYRNFCKMDVSNGVVVFFRRINNVTVNVLENESSIYSTVELIIEGSSFLWHQIRCIVAVLLLIGQKKEDPTIIDDLLDIEKYPSKPEYTMCSETPLILFDCQFNDNDWIYSQDDLGKVIKHLQDEWLIHQTKANIVKSMIDSSFQTYIDRFKSEPVVNPENMGNKCIRTLKEPYASLQGKSQSQVHIKFKDRRKVKTLESRVDHFVKKRRLDSDVYEKINEANNLAQTYNIYKPNKVNNNDKITSEEKDDTEKEIGK